MKIENTLKPTTTQAAPRAKAQATPGGAPAGNAADVRLSALAAQLAGGDDAPPVNAARVAEIRQAIAEGRFTIDSGVIADRLIATAQELLAGQRKA